MLETKYELMNEVYIQINRVDGDPAILNILYSVIANESPNEVSSNLCGITSDYSDIVFIICSIECFQSHFVVLFILIS